MARVPTKTISLHVDHVHMPSDLLSPKWETAQDTARYERKLPHPDTGDLVLVKYEVHADMADFLIERDQAVEVPSDKPARKAADEVV
jgi:hypothetical protein